LSGIRSFEENNEEGLRFKGCRQVEQCQLFPCVTMAKNVDDYDNNGLQYYTAALESIAWV
jgi:hypothetical protein